MPQNVNVSGKKWLYSIFCGMQPSMSGITKELSKNFGGNLVTVKRSASDRLHK